MVALMSWLADFFCVNFQKELKELRIQKNNLINDVNNLERINSEFKSLIEELDKERDHWYEKELECQTELRTKKDNPFSVELPSCFEPTTQNYGGNCTVISKLEEKELWYKKAFDSLEVTTFWDSFLDACKIKETDSALQVFNKILATEQRLVSYVSDVKQWGRGESWQRPSIEWITKKADCDGGAQIVVSVFEYYQLKHGRFLNAFCFAGTGYFNRTFEHAFPCLLELKSEATLEGLMNGLYIGESTLDAEIPARELKLVQGQYDLRMGCFSFWHNFGLKDELKWW